MGKGKEAEAKTRSPKRYDTSDLLIAGGLIAVGGAFLIGVLSKGSDDGFVRGLGDEIKKHVDLNLFKTD